MAQFFTGKPTPTCQSTPKPGHNPGELSGKHLTKRHDNLNQSITDTSFVSLDKQHRDEDSGVMLDISSIADRDESARGEITSEGASDTGYSLLLGPKIEEIEKKAQDLIERIHQSRAEDQEVIASFESKLLSKVTEVCQQVKEQMFLNYEEHNHGMEAGLHELSGCLERSSQLGSELQEVIQTLSAINTGLLQTPGPSDKSH